MSADITPPNPDTNSLTADCAPPDPGRTANYPPAAYAATGELWWNVMIRPGTKKAPHGAEPRIMAWLAYNKQIGEVFTTAELRGVLGEADSPNNQEHFQRRLREIRKDGWEIPSVKYDRNLSTEDYRVDVIGWHPGRGTERPKHTSMVDARTAREVLARDGSRCLLCGIGAGEPHPRNKDRPAAITVGHVRAGIQHGAGDLSNLRAECTICNEPVRSDAAPPKGYDEMLTTLRSLRNEDLRTADRWVEAGHRVRTKVDQFYDDLRVMSPGERDRLIADLRKMVKR